jgi:hypothetical protein
VDGKAKRKVSARLSNVSFSNSKASKNAVKIFFNPKFIKVTFQNFFSQLLPPLWRPIITHCPTSILPIFWIPSSHLPVDDSCDLAIVDKKIPRGDVRMCELRAIFPISHSLELRPSLTMFVGIEDSIVANMWMKLLNGFKRGKGAVP